MQSRYLLSTLLLVCSAATSADNAGWQNARTPQTTNSASDHVQNASQNTGGVPATLVKGELPAPGQASPLVQDAARLDSELSADEIRSLRSLMADNERAINAPITSVVPRISSLTVNLSPGASLPLVRTAMNNLSVVTFTDINGSPWPQSDPPYNAAPKLFDVQYNENMVTITPLRPWASGNISVYRTQLQNSSYTPPLGTVVSSSEQRMANAQDPKSALSEIMGPLVSLTNRIATETSGTGTTSAQINPLIKMKNIGDITMVSAEGIWTIYTTARVVVAGGKDSILVKFFNSLTGAASMLTALFEALAPPVYFLLFLMFCAGFSLSIYLPFIPFIFWMTGIGNWIVSVLIGCTAGPLWAATHLGTSEDRGSRAAYGYIYLIDSMIRPPIMVFGFFFASVAIIAVGTILNALFGAALVNVQFNSLTGIFSLAGFLLIYARICTTTVAAIFALQAYLPDHVINFLGGRDGANTLGSMANSVKEIFIGGSRNIRHTPGMKTDRLKDNTKGSDDKDGIKG